MTDDDLNKICSFPKRREIEYVQLCETYRQGAKTMLEMFKFYVLFHAGLGTVAGVIFSHVEFQTKVFLFGLVKVNFPLFILSLIGVLSILGARAIAERMYRYHDSVVARAALLESEYDMHLITGLGQIWQEGRSFRGGTRVAFVLFFLIAALWVIGIINSVEWVTAISN